MNQALLEQLKQLVVGPVWDGNLVSKTARDKLVELGVAKRCGGWNFLVFSSC